MSDLYQLLTVWPHLKQGAADKPLLTSLGNLFLLLCFHEIPMKNDNNILGDFHYVPVWLHLKQGAPLLTSLQWEIFFLAFFRFQ